MICNKKINQTKKEKIPIAPITKEALGAML